LGIISVKGYLQTPNPELNHGKRNEKWGKKLWCQNLDSKHIPNRRFRNTTNRVLGTVEHDVINEGGFPLCYDKEKFRMERREGRA